MSTLNQCGDVRKMYTKGATDVLLDRMLFRCREAGDRGTGGGTFEQGLRVLCFAARRSPATRWILR
ncbi:MAG: hypothetical protein ACLT3Y_02650 [Ruminococcus callidus]